VGTFLRITRHAAEAAQVECILSLFGPETRITEEDVPFGNDPVAVVKDLIAKHQDVVAIEIIAPLPVLAQILAARLSVPVVRSEFLRGTDGRVVVSGKDDSGRDILAFGGYVEIVRVEVVTRPLNITR